MPNPITIDAHMDTPWLQTKVVSSGFPHFSYRVGHESSMFTVKKAKEGGLKAAIFALYLSDNWQDSNGLVDVNAEINRQVTRLKMDLGLTVHSTVAGVRAANASGPFFPCMMGLEGGRLIHGSLARLSDLASKGIKYLTLTHNRNTDWADSATDSVLHGGLTIFGKKVVKECEILNVLVDVSHSADSTFYDVVSAATKPVIASHSGCRSLVKQPRNLTDEMIKLIAQSGGIVCIPYAKRFIGHYRVYDHIRHIIDLVGVDHVGIGSDLDGAQLVPQVESVADWKAVVIDDLMDNDHSSNDIGKILGENLLRVLGASE